jgi:hypothetical protein
MLRMKLEGSLIYSGLVGLAGLKMAEDQNPHENGRA